jgi:putative FmdB family regulatory protein
MPLFEFRCKACGHKENRLMKNYKINLIKCPVCKGFMTKQFPLPAKPIFNGNGFYETDYKKKGK